MEIDTVLAMDLSFELGSSGSDVWTLCRDTAAMVLSRLDAAPGIATPALIGYSQTARVIDRETLVTLGHEYAFGTNVHDAIRLARSILDEHRGPKRILFIADALPTTSLGDDGLPVMDYQAGPETAARTLAACRQAFLAGIRTDVLLLRSDSPFEDLAADMTDECGGTLGILDPAFDIAAEVDEYLAAIELLTPPAGELTNGEPVQTG